MAQEKKKKPLKGILGSWLSAPGMYPLGCKKPILITGVGDEVEPCLFRGESSKRRTRMLL